MCKPPCPLRAQVKYEEREVTAEQRAELARIIAAGGSAGARRAAAPANPAAGAPGDPNRAAAPEARLLAMAQGGGSSPRPAGSPQGSALEGSLKEV